MFDLSCVDLFAKLCPILLLLFFHFPMSPPIATLRLQVVVKAAEAVLVESIRHRLVVALTVNLKVVQQVSITAVLENQVYGS